MAYRGQKEFNNFGKTCYFPVLKRICPVCGGLNCPEWDILKGFKWPC